MYLNSKKLKGDYFADFVYLYIPSVGTERPEQKRETLWLFFRSVCETMKEVTETFQLHEEWKDSACSDPRSGAPSLCCSNKSSTATRQRVAQRNPHKPASGWCQQAEGSSPHLESRTPPQKFQSH